MFQFVPRKVAQKTHRPTQTSVPVASTSAARPPPPDHLPDTKGKGRSTDESVAVKNEDLVALLWLSLSDHSLWANVDLRRAVASADEGWIPLSYVLQQSPYISHLPVRPAEPMLIRAIRAQADCPLEVRMLVSSPSKAAWYGKESSSRDESGGYEIRRRDWSEALTRVRNSTRNEWEARTVYMESIPLSSRTIPGIFHFASFLSGHSDVQSITLPPHHLDRPGDAPKCKGFALVTFSNDEVVTQLVNDWPWHPRRTFAPEGSSAAHEAVKFGFRVLPKARWDELKEEYLAYRQRLLDEMSDASRVDAPPRAKGDNIQDEADTDTDVGLQAPKLNAALDLSAPFPPGCLVFVRNVHPETNKTTLKALFVAHAFGSASDSTSALDYVDYNKGMTSCHLRLSSPQHAQTLVSAFGDRPVVQRQGLDNAGSPASGDERPISAEVVDGEREELYWNKVPEKVRREAVRKAIAQLVGAGGGDGDGHGRETDEQQQGKRPRKRRRKA
ncbi:hypothetical protein L226DRAFT_542537 [Lentinus tigrinus ALCF2SS1-7]|uniref:XRRM domain-containing protein n=1 Tax=Lentinus tigrinus ALCF2SS1-6 TaxID=1328759 RepID=A0A5C2SUB7_9APHY|nr:hypothetical protein L227DRAFT_491040 [Lentinus tigrinus ALCF2SS1-6]RPD81414.1 hypothetical protein L226DRAFT_542537 [Lentinus tigrinus ALCF2SS1-7]